MSGGDSWRSRKTHASGEVFTTKYDPCDLIVLPTAAIYVMGGSTSTIYPQYTLTPTCYPGLNVQPTAGANVGNRTNSNSTISPNALRDPFYTTVIPMSYVLSAMTTVSYVLLIMLLILPYRARPLLQKFAVLSVVVCLTVALGKATMVLRDEYYLQGEKTYFSMTENSGMSMVKEKVTESKFIRVGNIISGVLLWLAQVQTLVRLFPRHREKIVLRWAGYILIAVDTSFAIMIYATHPETDGRLEAIPVFSYLFQIALAVTYALCVLFYSFIKREYAFFHRKAQTMPIVAIVSIASVLLPIIFFCLDIADKNTANWADYVRWAAAAAASVVVWEWVDRIEALERDARQDGVLGREVYEGDDGVDDSSADYDASFASSRGTLTRRAGRFSEKDGRFDSGDSGYGVHTDLEQLPPLPLSRSNTFTSTSTNQILRDRSSVSHRAANRTPSTPTESVYFSRGAIPAEGSTSDNTDAAVSASAGDSQVYGESEGSSTATATNRSKILGRIFGRGKSATGSQSGGATVSSDGQSQNSDDSGPLSGIAALGQRLRSVPTSILQSARSKSTPQPTQTRILPVTIIPPPPRNLTMSLRELEDAKRNGVEHTIGPFRPPQSPEPVAQSPTPQALPLPPSQPTSTEPVLSQRGSLLIEERHSHHSSTPNTDHYRQTPRSSLSHRYHSSSTSTSTPSSHQYTPSPAPSSSLHNDAFRYHHTSRTPDATDIPLPVSPPYSSSSPARETPPPAAGNSVRRTVLEKSVAEEASRMGDDERHT